MVSILGNGLWFGFLEKIGHDPKIAIFSRVKVGTMAPVSTHSSIKALRGLQSQGHEDVRSRCAPLQEGEKMTGDPKANQVTVTIFSTIADGAMFSQIAQFSDSCSKLNAT